MPARPDPSLRCFGSALVSAVLLPAVLLASAASAQMGHPTASRARTIHERLDAADRVVQARIGSVSEGRILVQEATALVGQTDTPFEIKRSPLRPHPLGEGDQAILFLRGARPPFVLVDEPGEVIRIVDEDQQARWVEAIRALAESRADSAELAATYLDWVDEGPASLRELGANGIFGIIDQDPALRDRLARDRVGPTVEASAPAEARRISAGIAAASPRSAGAVCAAIANSETPLDATVTEIALRGCARDRAASALRLLERAARHEDAPVRVAAARSLALVAIHARDAALAIARDLAENDPENAVRRAAERMLRDATRPPPKQRRAPQAGS